MPRKRWPFALVGPPYSDIKISITNTPKTTLKRLAWMQRKRYRVERTKAGAFFEGLEIYRKRCKASSGERVEKLGAPNEIYGEVILNPKGLHVKS